MKGKGGERAVTETERLGGGGGEEERGVAEIKIVIKHQENSRVKRELNIQAERDR